MKLNTRVARLSNQPQIKVVFEDEIKEQDGMAVMDMLRRASIDIDINRINSAGKPGMTQTFFLPLTFCLMHK